MQRTLLLLVLATILAAWLFLDQRFTHAPLVAHGNSGNALSNGIRQVTIRGSFDPHDLKEPGQPTIIEFYARDCVGCQKLNRHMLRFLALRPDVAVRRIRIPDAWDSEDVWNGYRIRIRSIPHVLIFGPGGELVAADTAHHPEGLDFLYGWMNDELQKYRKQHHR